MFTVKRRANREKKTRGKIPDLNRHSKKNYPPRTRALITCTTSTRTNNNAKFKEWFSLVPPHCVHCARFDILSSFFSETKCQTAKKNTGECFTTKLKSTCKNSGTFEEKNFTRKSHLRQSCTKPWYLMSQLTALMTWL